MPAFPELPPSRCGVATGAEYAQAGWTPPALRHAVASGRVERIAPGRFAPPPPADLNRHRLADLGLTRRAVAAAIPGDRIVVCHLAVGWLRGWPIWADRPRPCVTTWDPRITRVTGVHLHRVRGVDALRSVPGLSITSADRTIVDIAREFGTEAALVSGDVALRTGAVTLESLTAEILDGRGLYGIESARAVPELLDPLAESPLESRSRWHLDLYGLRPPHSQVILRTLSGRFLARVDHYWPEGVVGEADGRLKYEDDPFALPKEKQRQQELEDADLEVARWGAVDLSDFTAAAARVERARRRARRKLSEGPQLWAAFTRAGVRIPAVRSA